MSIPDAAYVFGASDDSSATMGNNMETTHWWTLTVVVTQIIGIAALAYHGNLMRLKAAPVRSRKTRGHHPHVR